MTHLGEEASAQGGRSPPAFLGASTGSRLVVGWTARLQGEYET